MAKIKPMKGTGLFLAMFVLTLAILLGIMNWFGYFSPFKTPTIDDIWVINLDKDAERWQNIQGKTRHLGNKVNLLALTAASALASFCAIGAGNVLAYGLVFVFMASSIALQGISRLSFIAELCSEAERPVYVALANTLTAPTVFIGIIFGALVPALGYDVIFCAAGTFGLAAFAVLWYRVVDPRRIIKE